MFSVNGPRDCNLQRCHAVQEFQKTVDLSWGIEKCNELELCNDTAANEEEKYTKTA